MSTAGGLRINVVSPPRVAETVNAQKMDPSLGMPAAAMARAYLASVEGTATGHIIDPRKFTAKEWRRDHASNVRRFTRSPPRHAKNHGRDRAL